MGCPRPDVPRSNPYDLGELEKVLRDRLYTLFHDAPTRGLTLVSGYRDPGRQWDIRAERVGAEHACDPRYKAVPATAIPAVWNGTEWVGGSDHQRRTAADIGGRDLQWAIDNRARYGLGLTVLSENWHIQARGTDKRRRRAIPEPTVRILEYPGVTYDNPGPIAPAPPADDQEFSIVDAATKSYFDGEFAKLKKEIDANEIRLADIKNDTKWIRNKLAEARGWLYAIAKTVAAGSADKSLNTVDKIRDVAGKNEA